MDGQGLHAVALRIFLALLRRRRRFDDADAFLVAVDAENASSICQVCTKEITRLKQRNRMAKV